MADNTTDWQAQANTANANAVSALQNAVNTSTPKGILGNIDPLWLGAAQGFLAPTKTGSFGESVSNAAADVQAPLSAMRTQQMSALEKIAAIQQANANMNMQAPYYASRADLYSSKADNLDNSGDSLGIDFSTPLKTKQTLGNQADLERQLAAAMGAETPDPVQVNRLQQIVTARRKLIDQKMGVQALSPPPAPAAPPAPPPAPGLWDRLFGTNASAPPAAPPAPDQSLMPVGGADTGPTMANSAPRAQPTQPAQPAPDANLTTGSQKRIKIGNDTVTATYAPDGKWYVVKDGKHYPVE